MEHDTQIRDALAEVARARTQVDEAEGRAREAIHRADALGAPRSRIADAYRTSRMAIWRFFKDERTDKGEPMVTNRPTYVVDYAKLGESTKPRRLHHDAPNQCLHLDRDQPMRPATPEELRTLRVCATCAGLGA